MLDAPGEPPRRARPRPPPVLHRSHGARERHVQVVGLVARDGARGVVAPRLAGEVGPRGGRLLARVRQAPRCVAVEGAGEVVLAQGGAGAREGEGARGGVRAQVRPGRARVQLEGRVRGGRPRCGQEGTPAAALAGGGRGGGRGGLRG